MEQIVLLQENRVVGRVHAETLGAYVKLTAECHVDLQGIWRAYLVYNDAEWRIGVLEPSGDGGFCARGKVEKRKLPDINACRAVIRTEVWVACEDPQTVFRDPVLRESMKTASVVLADRAERPGKIAVPLRNGCACAPALCLAGMMYYRGEEWAVLGVDENRDPVCIAEQNGNHLV